MASRSNYPVKALRLVAPALVVGYSVRIECSLTRSAYESERSRLYESSWTRRQFVRPDQQPSVWTSPAAAAAAANRIRGFIVTADRLAVTAAQPVASLASVFLSMAMQTYVGLRRYSAARLARRCLIASSHWLDFRLCIHRLRPIQFSSYIFLAGSNWWVQLVLCLPNHKKSFLRTLLCWLAIFWQLWSFRGRQRSP